MRAPHPREARDGIGLLASALGSLVPHDLSGDPAAELHAAASHAPKALIVYVPQQEGVLVVGT